MFKGTKNRPHPSVIATEMEALGARYNAFTSHEYTGYYAEVQSAKLDQAMDIIFDVYLNPLFSSDEIEREKGVIIQELNMYYDNPQRHIYDLFSKVLYGDQPAGWEIVGSKENIKRFNRNDFLNYRQKYYTGPSTAVIVAGNFKEGEVFKKIKETFSHLSRSKISKPKTLEFQKNPQILVSYRDIGQANLAIGLRAYDVFDKRRFALDILAEALGGGMSSRLWMAVREKLGAAYYISAGAANSYDHGVFSIGAGIEKEKINQALKVILKETAKLKEKLISDKELKKSIDSFVGKMILDAQTSDALAMFYGESEILAKNPESLKELVKKYQLVSKEEIRAVARDIFKNNKLNMALLGPYKEKDKNRIKKLFKF
jgi:predicted Zn-dependent peptidase